MSKVNIIENIVKGVLERHPITRDDDFILVAFVYNAISEGRTNCISFNSTMANHRNMGLPSMESITRARRKLQNEYEELRATESMRRIRRKEEQDFREYLKC